ncbi:MAG: class I mannose-6-phosphate isomerase [Ilumatobacter sp.]|nr:class I mannose-6-phosphate isomerase [Ilumatobacter sp.]
MPDNRVPVYYKGGGGIDKFRVEPGDFSGPEDWVGSLTRLPESMMGGDMSHDVGMSTTLESESLRNLVDNDPQGWLGQKLADHFGGESGLLVKILDAGERLPVHCHPTRSFAARNLASVFGKTEGWIIMDATPGAKVWLGLREDIDRATLRRWIERHDVPAMLSAMNQFDVERGQAFFVKAGLPHSIGPGVMLTELQEPTSFSVLAEYENFGLTEDQATLGLSWELALSCFDLGGYRGDRISELLPDRIELSCQSGGTVFDLFPPEANTFFSARLVKCSSRVVLDQPSFAVLVITEGSGELSWAGGSEPVRRGETWVVPFGAGSLSFTGTVEALVCLPPEV